MNGKSKFIVQHYWHSIKISRLVEGILFSIVGIIGFLGNTLSILVLISPQVGKITQCYNKSKPFYFFQLWKYTFNRLLVALAVFDLIFVMVTVPIHTFAVFEYSNWFFAAIYSRYPKNIQKIIKSSMSVCLMYVCMSKSDSLSVSVPLWNWTNIG